MCERKRYFFIRSVIADDRGKLAVQNEEGMGRGRKRPILGPSQLAAATLTANLFRLAGGLFFPFKKLRKEEISRSLTQTPTNTIIIYLIPNLTFIHIVQDHLQEVITKLNVQD